MPTTLAYKLCGQTIGLSVANTSHAAVTINSQDESANALLITNSSTSVEIYFNVSSTALGGGLITAAAAVVPTDGGAGSFPVLAYDDTAIAGVRFPVSVTAIGGAAGPTLVTVTPICLL